MIAVGLFVVAGAIVLVRFGWGGRRGAAPLGWALAIAGLTILTLRDGAWGLAIGTAAAIAMALALVLQAGWVSPNKPQRPAREPSSVTIPARSADLAGRLAVFLLVVPFAFVAAQWLAFGIQAIARRIGAAEADAVVLALFLQPILWGVIMTVQMTRAGPRRMVAPPTVAAVAGTILWGAS